MDTQIFNKVEVPKNNESEPVSHPTQNSHITDDLPDLASVNKDDEPVDFDLSEEPKKTQKKKRKKVDRKDGASPFVTNLYDWVSAFLFALVLVVMVMTFCFRLVDVDGDSMLQTLQDKNKIIVTGLNYEPCVGDIVVISHGVELDKALVKRVIAVGGQTVDINSDTGEVIVDGIVIEEPYINGKTTQIGNVEFPVTVDEGTVFVLGDNRPISKDSRFSDVGMIPVESIIGKVRLRLTPFSEFGKVE
ncbi:MAG: signal peptidase I [Clostridia bacterium]|nr:signal peptidase I [Clostridia bacterium]